MKTLHKLDFPIQITILIGSFLSMLFEPAFILIGFYFGIGGWQALIAFVFAFDDLEIAVRDSGRLMYERTLLSVVVIAMVLAFFPQALFGYGVIMLFVGVIMAFWNMSIAYNEFKLAKSEHQVWDID